MTSKNSFWNNSRWNFKKRLPYFVLCFMGCFFLMPVTTFIECSNDMLGIDTPVASSGAIAWMQQKLALNACFESGPQIIMTVAMAITFALTAFSWNNQQNKVDFYKALPIKESSRFVYIHLNSLLMFLICFGGNLLLTNLSIALWKIYTPKLLTVSLVSLLCHTLMFLAVYFLTTITQLLTGSSILAVFGTAFLLGVEPLMYLLNEAYRNCFFATSYSAVRGGFYLGNGYLTPIGAYTRGLENMGGIINRIFYGDSVGTQMLLSFLTIALQAVVYCACAYLLYKKRPSHAGSSNICFGFAKPIIKIAVMVSVSLTTANLFYTISQPEMPYGIFGLVSGLIISQIVMQFILEGDFRQVLKGIPSFLIGCAATIAFFAYFPLSAKSFDHYLPKREQVESVAIVRSNEYRRTIYGDWYNGNYEVVRSTSYLMDKLAMTEPQVIDALFDTMRRCMENNTYASLMAESEGETVCVRYHLKGNKKVSRQYYLPKEEVQRLYLGCCESKNYQELTNPFNYPALDKLALDPDCFKMVHYETWRLSSERFYGTGNMFESMEAKRAIQKAITELYQAMKEDAASRTVETIKTQYPIGMVSFTFAEKNPYDEESGFASGVDRRIAHRVPLYEQDTKSVAAMQALWELLGMEEAFTTGADPAGIQKITIRRLDRTMPDGYYDRIPAAVDASTREVDLTEAEENPIIVELTPDSPLFEQVLDCVFETEVADLVVDAELPREPDVQTSVLKDGVMYDVNLRADGLPEEIRLLLKGEE